MRLAIEDGYDRLLRPSVEREVSGQLSEFSDDHAITVFAANLRNLLLQPPLRERALLGIDPGFRTGCKVATVDPTGKLLHTVTIYPHEPRSEHGKSLQVLAGLVEIDKISVIAIGNGTAGRETEALVAELIQTFRVSQTPKAPHLAYVMVSEAGASVYSASRLARAELPDLDVTIRGAVSIARRFQDPLAELVKIEPKAIGVGLYQHDVDQKALGETLDGVVESAVNSVGADLNTASPALLRHISGIGPKTRRRDRRLSRSARRLPNPRELLKQVSGVGSRTFEQAAGFLRVSEGKDALDSTPIHPESYGVARSLLDLIGLPLGHPDLPSELVQQWTGRRDEPDDVGRRR